jgi:hypothetical protein
MNIRRKYGRTLPGMGTRDEGEEASRSIIFRKIRGKKE